MPTITCAIPSVVQVVSATSAGSHPSARAYAAPQRRRQLAATLEVGLRPPLAQLPLELSAGGLHGPRGQRAVGARVQVGELLAGRGTRRAVRMAPRSARIARMSSVDQPQPMWTPSPEQVQGTEMARFMRWAAERHGLALESYDELWRWSVGEFEEFWADIWEFCGVRASKPYERVLGSHEMPGTAWFAGAELNYAENLLAGHDPGEVAVLHSSELRELAEMTWGELSAQVAAAAGGLRALGVQRGDRVVAYMPNIPETLIAFLAVAGIGAIWSSAAPEFGARSVIDRFAQIEPKVLLTVDGYRHGGKDFDRTAVAAAILAELPTVRHTVVLPYLSSQADPAAIDPAAICWPELLERGRGAQPSFEQVPFDHPLWVLYSSGTTGLPKAIVHGHGGILLEQLKKRMHLDLRAGDRMFWFTTTGWMMWNFLVGCLHSQAAIVLYDGSPAHPDLSALWRLAERAGITCMGLSAGLLAACEKARHRARLRTRPERPAGDRLDRLAALARELPLGLRAGRPGDLAVLDQRRHRRLHRLRRRLPDAPRLRGRAAVPGARLRGRVLGRAGQEPDRRGGRAGRDRADALDAAVPVGR